MNSIDFVNWLNRNTELSKKTKSDISSRLNKIEHSLIDCDLDDEFEKDGCTSLLKSFKSFGNTEELRSWLRDPEALPIGKVSIATYRYSLRLYIQFKESSAL